MAKGYGNILFSQVRVVMQVMNRSQNFFKMYCTASLALKVIVSALIRLVLLFTTLDVALLPQTHASAAHMLD